MNLVEDIILFIKASTTLSDLVYRTITIANDETSISIKIINGNQKGRATRLYVLFTKQNTGIRIKIVKASLDSIIND